MKEVRVLAPAKVNIALRVGPPRPDGFHPLETVFEALDLFDEVIVRPAEQLSLNIEGAPGLPTDSSNLAMRAAHALREHMGWAGDAGQDATAEKPGAAGQRDAAALKGAAGSSSARTDSGDPARSGEPAHSGRQAPTGAAPGAQIVIRKRIPVAGGMAGGSADAAGALVALNELWGCGLSQQELMELGARLGSDVPFSIHGSLALGRGRGELLTPLPCGAMHSWVLLASGEGLSTPAVFREFDRLAASAPQPDAGGADLAASGSDLAASGSEFDAGGSEFDAGVPDSDAEQADGATASTDGVVEKHSGAAANMAAPDSAAPSSTAAPNAPSSAPASTAASSTAAPAAAPSTPGSTAALREALAGSDLSALAEHMVNDLQAPALSLRPDLTATFEQIADCGIARILSGSGPTIAILAADAASADALAARLAARLPELTVLRANGPAAGAHVAAVL